MLFQESPMNKGSSHYVENFRYYDIDHKLS